MSEKNVLTKAPDNPGRDRQQCLSSLEAVSGQFFHCEAAFTEKKVDFPAKVSDAWKLVKEAIADMKKGS